MKDTISSRDPFADPALRGPSLWRSLQESFGGKKRLLDVAQIEVTSHCPGGCAYCPHTTMGEQWKARHMPPEVFVRLWPLLLETERVHLQGWGEPLLHPRFFDMVKLARKADCLVSTTSCGLFMNEKMATSIVGSGIDIIAFSLTGATKESNNAARSGVDFDTVINNIRLLQDVRKKKMAVHLEVHFAYLMLASHVEEVHLLPGLMQDLGIHAAVVSTLDYIPGEGWEKEAFLPHEQEKIAAARVELEKAVAEARRMDLSLYFSLPVPKEDAPRTCLEDPSRSIYVDADGVLAPCIYVNIPTDVYDPMRRAFGSVLEQNPLDIWNSERFAAFREALTSGSPEDPCINCPKRFAKGNRQG